MESVKVRSERKSVSVYQKIKDLVCVCVCVCVHACVCMVVRGMYTIYLG